MANTQATFGFRHVGYQAGAAPDYQQTIRALSSTNLTAIGFGDPVIRVNATSPYITQATMALATAGSIEGIFVGCVYTPTSGLKIPTWSPNWPGATTAADAVAYVIDAPNARFLAATLLTAITSGYIGNVVGFTTGSPNSATGNSIATVDQSTLATTGAGATTMPFRVLGIAGYGADVTVGNGTDQSTSYNWVIVGFNNQFNRNYSLGV